MSSAKVAAIRKENNNITVDRLFLDENANNPEATAIPNPIETFEQCFANYPDLLGTIYSFVFIFFCMWPFYHTSIMSEMKIFSQYQFR